MRTHSAGPPLPEGVPVGPWVLRPLVVATVGHDSNIFLQSESLSPISDETARAKASLVAALPFKNSLLTLSTAREWRTFRSYELPQNGSFDLGAEVDLKFSTHDVVTVSAKGTDGIADTYLFDPGGEVAFTAQPFRYFEFLAGVERDVPGQRGYRVRASPKVLRFDAESVSFFFDYNGIDVEGEYREPIRKDLWLTVDAGTRSYDHFCFGTDPLGAPCPGRVAPFREEDDILGHVGIRGALSQGRGFFAKVGWGRYAFSPSVGSDFDGPLWDAAVRLVANRRSRLDVTIGRRVFPSFYLTNNYYLWDGLETRFERSPGARWVIGGALNLSRARYPDSTTPDPNLVPDGAPRRDTTGRLEAYANLMILDRVGIRVSALMQRRDSNDRNSDYRGETYLVGMFFGWL